MAPHGHGAAPIVHVTAVVLTDAAGRLLLVRKRGTAAFMQPGGKPEPGEGPLEAGVREVQEELGLALSPARLTPLGRYREVAANEAGHVVVADAFRAVIDDAESAAVRPAAEIAEAVWATREEARALPLAPLTRTHVLPLL